MNTYNCGVERNQSQLGIWKNISHQVDALKTKAAEKTVQFLNTPAGQKTAVGVVAAAGAAVATGGEALRQFSHEVHSGSLGMTGMFTEAAGVGIAAGAVCFGYQLARDDKMGRAFIAAAKKGYHRLSVATRQKLVPFVKKAVQNTAEYSTRAVSQAQRQRPLKVAQNIVHKLMSNFRNRS